MTISLIESVSIDHYQMFNSSNQKASNAATMEVETLTDISDFVGDHVLVVVDSRKRDLGLVRGKGGDL